MSQPRRLALIDGHALAFRAFHALKDADLRSSRGEPTYAVFGFAQMLLTMLQEQQPEYVAVAFDVGRTFRDELYAEYKAGRAETPEEFEPQLERIKQLVRALNIPIYTAEGYEADDVIGALARQATAQGLETLILTGDTDTLQLVDEHVRVILANPYGARTTTTLYDLAKVRERYDGLLPAQLADLRGLKGDASDNIPGVRGIGEKGAITLLKQFGSIENLFDHLDEAPNRYKKVLEGQREVAEFSKRLATIVCDAPVTLDLKAAAVHDYDRAAVIRLFQELEIGASSGLIKKLPPSSGPAAALAAPAANGADEPAVVQQDMFSATLPATLSPGPAEHGGVEQLALFETERPALATAPAPVSSGDYRLIATEADLADLVTRLTAAPAFAFDTEATGLRPFDGELVGISLAIAPGAAVYVPVGHHSGPQLPRAQVLAALRPFFEDPARAKYAHNAKFDLEMLMTEGIAVRGLAFDTMIAAALLGKQRVGLKELAFFELRLPEPPTSIEELIGRGRDQRSFAEVPVERAAPYAAADADLTLRLKAVLEAELARYDRLGELFTRLELPLIPVLADMERAGILLDVDYMRQLAARLEARIAALEEEIYAQAGERFNINSGQQLNQVLFESGKFGLDPKALGLSRLKTGGYSITAEVLEQLAPLAPIAESILRYRQLTKLKSTYVDALPALVNPRTGRIHTSYNQIGTATGRLSSDSPNLQNIPVRTEEGREIRRGFVAAPGHRFIAADYSQIELRVLAHITRDPALLETFRAGRDIHAATAAFLFGVPQDRVDKNQRRIAKTVVFGIIYGISAFGLAQRLGIERAEAQTLIDGVFASFPGIRAYIDATLEHARRTGYVSTLFGRRRHFPELMREAKGPRAQAAMREAINAPIQGTAADLMKIAMINVHRQLQERGLATRLLLQVHDELILEAPEGEVETAAHLVAEVMEQVYALEVPLAVEVESGPNWDELRPLAIARR
ncbi:MAG: DNA polymerase I [Oscillochloridaceae bacterium]|nr:DNA polymerase I [Chloroflexaceae bacterium]MDW8391594.1 DNA polymerase I [Oscillochloridaceae bacterium]